MARVWGKGWMGPDSALGAPKSVQLCQAALQVVGEDGPDVDSSDDEDALVPEANLFDGPGIDEINIHDLENPAARVHHERYTSNCNFPRDLTMKL